jgi:predicted nucleotidyltransferase
MNATAEWGLAPTVLGQIRSVLARFPSIEQAILYGSRAKGNFRPGSDIDLALVAPELTERQLSALDAALDDLLLPYTFDLCQLASLNNSALIEHIQRVGQVLYARS